MANSCILQLALLLCFSTTVISINYDLLQFHQKSSNVACRTLLLQLNSSCMITKDFQAPKEIQQPQQLQKEKAVLIIQRMALKIFDIFTRNFSSTGWNETIVENLQEKLFWQMNRLETALKEGNITWEGEAVPKWRLEAYYSRIVQYLKAQSYSRCAWTVVQREILRNISFLNRLTDCLQN
ncbi:PREDICTED: interferon beta [Miniopterus natalensis]|uniref:interferon beta n=1 Tax=Miniopterus natalensis TaxID=291302 RepID=UPI0007A70FB4|nr:PREDICTED: interferon beta [Miniopterus natalensis]